MTLSFDTSVPLDTLSTFRMGGRALEMATIGKEEDLPVLFNRLPAGRAWFVLGGGSNCIFPEGEIQTLIIRLKLADTRILKETRDAVTVEVGAGTVWDSFVEDMVARGFSGIEALSAIPGTVGATPIQNVGAYGVETKDVLVSLRAFDTQTKKFVILKNKDCDFGYRDSIFKGEAKGRYIITSVIFKLSKKKPRIPKYPGVAEYFAEKGIQTPTLTDIRSAICAIRARKLPDPKEIASVGSFFKNPIIAKEEAEALKTKYPTLAVFSVDEKHAKVGAGSLIDTMGWKGKSFGSIGIYEHNALVLVNTGRATRVELLEAVSQIIEKVHEVYGITLTMEPEILEI